MNPEQLRYAIPEEEYAAHREFRIGRADIELGVVYNAMLYVTNGKQPAYQHFRIPGRIDFLDTKVDANGPESQLVRFSLLNDDLLPFSQISDVLDDNSLLIGGFAYAPAVTSREGYFTTYDEPAGLVWPDDEVDITQELRQLDRLHAYAAYPGRVDC
jgi:hypothetical protein